MREPKKIFILGITGSGKTWLSKRLSCLLEIKYYDLDDLEWSKKYSERRDFDDKVKELKKILKKDKWIVEGIYTHWTEEAVKKSDLLVWLKFDFGIVRRRLIWRFLKNKFYGEKNNLRNLKSLIRFAKNYCELKEKNGAYRDHLELIEKSENSLVVVDNNKKLRGLICEIKRENKKW